MVKVIADITTGSFIERRISFMDFDMPLVLAFAGFVHGVLFLISLGYRG
jgi:hypothetical protein